MLSFSSDQEAGVLILVWTGPHDSDEEYAQSLELIRADDAAAAARRIPFVCIVDVSQESPQPSPVWRRRMSQTHSAVRSDPYYSAMVAPTAVVRGIFTAVGWLVTMRRPGHRAKAWPTFSEAAKWVREVSGRSYPMLETLHGRAQRKADSISPKRTPAPPI